MRGYFWIGLGGALGSMARAWLTLAVARALGPRFPWGTILINVVGSFVIGFFGTLTTRDSRFAVPFDVRVFVMIGLCGGFTTFSSFSLQTLELTRAGRIPQALANIGLSVVLCIVAVAAGHYGAEAIHRAHAAIAVRGADNVDAAAVRAMPRPGETDAGGAAGSDPRSR